MDIIITFHLLYRNGIYSPVINSSGVALIQVLSLLLLSLLSISLQLDNSKNS